MSKEQISQQAVVVPKTEMRFGQTSLRLSLFNTDGSPLDPPNKTDLPISALDPIFGLTGVADNTESIQAGWEKSGLLGRSFHFPMRPLGQPYVIGGDGYLLSIPTGLNTITSDPNVVLKVKSSNGNYKAMIGASTSIDLTNLIIQNLVFDQNTPGNPVSNVSTLLVEGTQRFCIYVGSGSNIRIQNCQFRNVDGLNTCYIGSPTMKDVRIQDCEFDVIGASSAWHDHSTIYTSCDGSSIVNNKFRGVLGGLGATTAIETHGPNQVVIGNRVESYKIGSNITGLTNLGNDMIHVKDNNFRNVLLGIQLWSWSGTNGGLVDIIIEGNNILINRDPWTLGSSDFARGVCLNQAASGSGSVTNINNLKIIRNNIRYKSFIQSLTNDYQNSGGIELVSQDSSVQIIDGEIAYNSVINAIGPALRVGVKLCRVDIHDNHWVDPVSTSEASPPSAWKSAVVMTGNADFIDVRKWSNRTYDTRGTRKLVQGWLTSLSTGNAVRCEEWDNTVVCYDGGLIPENSQTIGKRFSSRGVPVGRRLKTGLYHTAQGGTPTTLALVSGQEYAIPFEVGSQQSFNEIAANVTVVGGTGGLLRFGLRLDDGTGAPGALVADFGTVSSETLASRAVTISQTFPSGNLWLTVTAQVSGCTVTAISGWLVGASGASSVAGAIGGRSAHYQTGVTGSLPATFTSGGQTPNAPAVFVKAA